MDRWSALRRRLCPLARSSRLALPWVRWLDAGATAQLHADLLAFSFDASAKPNSDVTKTLQVCD
ncbi:MAG: hypothetical protein IH905_05805 [Proteobacteria bacterium]|nr:hypothetical protein [Pseudomonadota bacterium]